MMKQLLYVYETSLSWNSLEAYMNLVFGTDVILEYYERSRTLYL